MQIDCSNHFFAMGFPGVFASAAAVPQHSRKSANCVFCRGKQPKCLRD